MTTGTRAGKADPERAAENHEPEHRTDGGEPRAEAAAMHRSLSVQ